MAEAAVGPIGWERALMAAEKVKERLRRATHALDAAGVPYAVAGGNAVAEWIAGRAGHVNWDLVPAIVYTEPELAGVGIGEDAAKGRSLDVKIGKFNFAANGRAIASDATDGFAKIVADAMTDRILGAQILGRGASELISEVVTHMEYGGSAEDLGRTIHAHPTFSEAIKEAGLAVSKSAIHAI